MKKKLSLFSFFVFILLFSSCITPSSSVQENKQEENPSIVNPYSENDPLYLGNPSNALTDVLNSENYLMEKPQYSLSYNNSTHIPNWVSWHLDQSDIGDQDRTDSFREDDSLPAGFYRVKASDYQFSKYGFDRGHMCPSADRTDTLENNSATFYMTNMVPQTPNNNRNVWMNLEKYERSLVDEGYELYIYSGSIGKGGVNNDGETVEYLAWSESNKNAPDDEGILVPAYNFKIIVAIIDGEDDISRITEDTLCISVIVPNTKSCTEDTGDYTGAQRWKNYLTTVDVIEEQTGFDFLSMIDDELEEKIEMKKFLH